MLFCEVLVLGFFELRSSAGGFTVVYIQIVMIMNDPPLIVTIYAP